jgi:hypothetical protein
MTTKCLRHGTTLNEIDRYGPCETGIHNLLSFLGKEECDDTFVKFETILESNELHDAVWCLRTVADDHEDHLRKYMGHVVEAVAPIWADWAQDESVADVRLLYDIAEQLKNGKNPNMTRESPYARGQAGPDDACHSAWRVANYVCKYFDSSIGGDPDVIVNAVTLTIHAADASGWAAKSNMITKQDELFKEFWCKPEE